MRCEDEWVTEMLRSFSGAGESGGRYEVLPDEPLETPVVLISQEAVEEAEAKLSFARAMTVTDEGTFRSAGLMRKDIANLLGRIEE